MQRIVEFKARNFWSSKVDISELNEKIQQYNSEGWRVLQATPISTFAGVVAGYSLLLEKN